MNFLIDEKYIKEWTFINTQKNHTDLSIALNKIHALYIKDLLGIPLLELFQDAISNNTALTTKQATVLEQVKMCNALMVEWILMNNPFAITNKGNQTEVNAPSDAVVKSKRQEILTQAESIKSKILDYLEDNRSDFPEYFADESSEQIVNKKSSNSPIVFLPMNNFKKYINE